MSRPVVVRRAAVASSDVLYCAATISSAGIYQIQLWMDDGSGTWAQQTTYSLVGGVVADSLYWCAATSSLLLAVMRSSDYNHAILAWDPGTASFSVFKDWWYLNDYDPVSQMVEFGGDLYVLVSGQTQNPATLYRMDPASPDASFETVYSNAEFNYDASEGGLAVVGSKLWAIGNEWVAWSTTGDSGSWTATDMYAGYLCADMAAGKLDPDSGEALFVGWKPAALAADRRRQLWRIDGSGLVLEYEEYVDNQSREFAAIATAAGQSPRAIQWRNYYTPPSSKQDIMVRTGHNWSVEEQVDFRTIAGTGTGGTQIANNSCLYWRGKLYTVISVGTPTSIFRRDGLGSWVEAKQFPTAVTNTMYHYGGFPLAVGYV